MAGVIVLFSLLGLLIVALGLYRWMERRKLKGSVKAGMSRGLRLEIETEEKDAERRKKSFEQQLKKFGL